MNNKLLNYVYDFNNVWNNKCSNYEKLPNILPAVDRIIVIGDIHGDMTVLIECLLISGVIDNNNNWIGGETVIVQVGDQIDSCRYDGKNNCNDVNTYKIHNSTDNPHDVKILYYMTELHNKARKDGGAVYSLLGNHELMNVNGDMAYVSHNNIRHFDNFVTSDGNTINNGMDARKHLFKPGNQIANFLACTRKIALIIGSNLFVHAGIVPQMVKKYNIDELNILLSLYLLNELKNPEVFYDVFNSGKISPLWTRIFGNTKHSTDKCDELMTPLKDVYKVGRIIVGHTPQINTGITSTCNKRIWLTDVGMPEAFNPFDQIKITTGNKSAHREAQVLEILKDGKKINIIK